MMPGAAGGIMAEWLTARVPAPATAGDATDGGLGGKVERMADQRKRTRLEPEKRFCRTLLDEGANQGENCLPDMRRQRGPSRRSRAVQVKLHPCLALDESRQPRSEEGAAREAATDERRRIARFGRAPSGPAAGRRPRRRTSSPRFTLASSVLLASGQPGARANMDTTLLEPL